MPGAPVSDSKATYARERRSRRIGFMSVFRHGRYVGRANRFQPHRTPVERRKCTAARQFDQLHESFERHAGDNAHRRIAEEILRAQPRRIAAIDLVDTQFAPIVTRLRWNQRTVKRDGQNLLGGIVIGRTGMPLVGRAFLSVTTSR